MAHKLFSMIPEGGHYPEWGREAFLESLSPEARILDVGCGNGSPRLTKNILPSCYYVGLDVADYNQDPDNPSDEYILSTSERFRSEIYKYADSMDAVMSWHNIEHCEDRYGVVDAMAKALRVGGKIYISFPCAESVNFPSRAGTLNYYDDATHVGEPPDFGKVVSILSQNGLSIIYAASRYQPPIHWLVGLGNDELSTRDGVLKDGTWRYWGFECLIWAERR